MKRFGRVLVGALPALLSLALLGAAAGDDPSAHDIMEKNFFVSRIKSLRAESYMVLINDKGQKRERRNTSMVKLQPNGVDSKLLVRFTTPTDIKGTSFLQVEHIEGEDDLWIYLPALKKSRRLVANNKKDSFVGSDFSYGDISLPKVDLYRHTLLRSESVDDHDCYVIESVPANEVVKSNNGYSKKITWVRKDNFLEAKVEYYDLGGRLLKTQVTSRHELVEPDTQRWFALYREMTNHQTGHRTVLQFDKLEPGVELSDDLFTTRYVERE
jgi:outer membrane lipoprotein-sorting protein